MFREMRRFKQAISLKECEEILTKQKRAVISLIGEDGYPYGLPINYIYVPEDHCIYFHSAKCGHKIDALKQCDKVCFTVINEGYREPNDWAYHVTSVIAFGKAELMTDQAKALEVIYRFGMKYFPTETEVKQEIKASFASVQMVAIHIEHLTGKTVYER